MFCEQRIDGLGGGDIGSDACRRADVQSTAGSLELRTGCEEVISCVLVAVDDAEAAVKEVDFLAHHEVGRMEKLSVNAAVLCAVQERSHRLPAVHYLGLADGDAAVFQVVVCCMEVEWRDEVWCE